MAKGKKNSRPKLVSGFMEDDDEEYDELLASPPLPIRGSRSVSTNNDNDNDDHGSRTTANDNNNNNNNGNDSQAIRQGSPQSTTSRNSNSHATSDGIQDSQSPAASQEDDPEPEEEEQAVLEQTARDRLDKSPVLVQDIAKKAHYNVEELLWHEVPAKQQRKGGGAKKKAQLLPCRKAHPDEGKALCLSKRNAKDAVLVQYFCCSDAGNYFYASPRQLCPLVDPETKQISKDKMTAFGHSLRNQAKYKGKPLQVVLEQVTLERIVQACLNEKREEEEEVASTSKKSPNNVPAAADSLVQEMPADSSPEGASDIQGDNDEEDHRGFSQIWQEEHDEQTKQSSSSSVEESPEAEWDPDQKQRKQTLKEGCVVKYDAPNSVAGSNVLQSIVWAVTPKNEQGFALHLENGQMLQREDRVQLVQKILRGKAVPHKGGWMPISHYRLEPSTDPERLGQWAGMKQVEMIKSSLQRHKEELASNPETALAADMMRVGRGGNSKSNQKDGGTTESHSKKRKASPVPSAKMPASTNKPPPASATKKASASKKKAATPITGQQEEAVMIADKWWYETSEEDIQKLAERAEQEEAKRRGKVQHMSSSLLRLAIRARHRLQELAADSTRELAIDVCLDELRKGWETDHGFESTEFEVRKFLSGDRNSLVACCNIIGIGERFQEWLEKVGDAAESKHGARSVEGSEENANAEEKPKATRKLSRTKRAKSEAKPSEKQSSIELSNPRNLDSSIDPNSEPKKTSTGKKRRLSEASQSKQQSSPAKKRSRRKTIAGNITEPVVEEEDIQVEFSGDDESKVESDQGVREIHGLGVAVESNESSSDNKRRVKKPAAVTEKENSGRNQVHEPTEQSDAPQEVPSVMKRKLRQRRA